VPLVRTLNVSSEGATVVVADIDTRAASGLRDALGESQLRAF